MIKSHCISTVNFNITRLTGNEGPRYDPYLFEEFHVSFRPDLKIPDITLHEGLCEWIKIGEKIIPECNPHRVFTRIIGFTTTELHKWEQKLKSKCRSCGDDKLEYTKGNTDEFLIVCPTCGSIIDSEIIVKGDA